MKLSAVFRVILTGKIYSVKHRKTDSREDLDTQKITPIKDTVYLE